MNPDRGYRQTKVRNFLDTTVSVDPDFGGRQAAEQIARNALQELP